ncbi:sugar ABC transporter substrate-binding protein [Pantoea sp. BAV 3049]|uniref:ABC transporter substrate-binding protein n=1 Tax=Pantoea sp. BAV 3049 TaxID=2654188 RepID=UPI00131A8E14|nr:sugar ABC transporter substrate-binding protein [Pantoea sp. BAV 3049]
MRKSALLALMLALPFATLADTTVTIATIANGDMSIMQQLSGDFEKSHPGVHLKWQIMSEAELRRQNMEAMSSGKPGFDVITVGTYEAPLWGKRGWLTPLNSQPADYQAEDLLKPVRKALSWNDTLYALPFYGESSMTYYRKDLLAEKGLIMPDDPNWSDIKRLAAKLNDRQKGIYGLCLRGSPGWGDNMAIIDTMANSYGAQWFDDNWKAMLDSTEWREVLQDYVQMVHDYGPADTPKNSFGEILRLFAQGKCAMWVDSTVAASLLINPQISLVADKIDFAPAPGELTRNGSNWLWAWALAVPSNAPNKQQAVEFISWATSRAYINQVAQTVGWGAVPPGSRISTYQQASYLKLAPYAQRVRSAVESASVEQPTLMPVPYQGVQYVSIPGFDQMGNTVGEQIAELLQGKLTLDETLSKNQQAVTRIYAETPR